MAKVQKKQAVNPIQLRKGKQNFIEGMSPAESVPEDIIKAIEKMFKLKQHYESYREAEKKIRKYMNANWGTMENAEEEVIINTDAAKLFAIQDRVTYKIHILDKDADPEEFRDSLEPGEDVAIDEDRTE